ncbi:MAG: DJ-1/PfpI family protein [Candidatus Thorarchaeota archaeon]|jgi:putative intracellular protease/amidase
MRFQLIVVTTLLVFSLVFSSPRSTQPVAAVDVSDVNVLVILCDGFGWNYFDAKERLEAFGVNVTTVANSIDYDIDSCANRAPRPITADLLMSEMTPEMVQQFDCLLVTSGGHWANMIASSLVMTFISDAFDLGLIVASICTGTRMVAEANDIVNGSKVVSFTLSSPQMMSAGATPIWGVEAVADGRIITGGRGGGTTGGGWMEAPTSEVCAEIVREVLSLSRVTDVTINPSSAEVGSNFSVSVMTDNLNETLNNILSTGIEEVTAVVYTGDNRTLVEEIPLSDDDHDGTYTGGITGLEVGDYILDIEVEDSNETVEVCQALRTFSVESGTTQTGTIDNLLIVGIASAGVIAVIVLVVVFVKKR